MKRFLTSLIVGAIMLVTGMLTGQLFQLIVPSIKSEYINPSLFRPWNDPIMSLVFVEPFVIGFILVWLWDKTNSLVKGETFLERGLKFGFIYWCISIPGMIMSYSSFPVSLILVISWSISGLIQTLCAGIYLSKVIK